MIPVQAADLLNELPLGDKEKAGSLRHLAFIIGGHVYNATKSAVKERVVSVLSEYYCAPNRFEQLWTGLSAAERKIISLHIWGAGSEPVDCADEVAEEFGLAERSGRAYYYFYGRNGLELFKQKYAGKNSALWLFSPKSPGGRIFQI
jgi:hypothetical protein